jgi:predicted PurR-regulated permease PerM
MCRRSSRRCSSRRACAASRRRRQPFLPALIWATLIVVSTWPLMQMVPKRLWNKRGLAVTVMTGALLLVVVLPLAFAALTIADHARTLPGG